MGFIKELEKLYSEVWRQYPGEMTVLDYLQAQAEVLAKAHQRKSPAVYWQISNWHPELVGKKCAQILKTPFSDYDAQWTIAREHGFADWDDAQRRGNTHADLDFEYAVEAVINGGAEELHALLHQNPKLIHATSSFGHRATLLHYIAANGVETRRQKIPSNAVDIVQTLIAAGARTDALMHVYNGQFDTLSLLTSSAHAVNSGLTEHITALLQHP